MFKSVSLGIIPAEVCFSFLVWNGKSGTDDRCFLIVLSLRIGDVNTEAH